VVFFGSFFIAFMRLLPRLVLASSAVPRGVQAALAILLGLMASFRAGPYPRRALPEECRHAELR